ncbi:MAG: sigma-70 family RNA polymerase sigma factor, partial [Eubacterium sp.]|nr:sigma-70 family RNA polymerase sigma factor [Eubacterium sp.]
MVLDREEDVVLAEKIYKKYCRFMYVIAYDVLKNKSDAEDAVSEAFLKIINNIDKIEGLEDKRTRNFIGIICRNTAVKIYNKNKRNKNIQTDGEESHLPQSCDISDIIISRENLRYVLEYINNMDDKYREVLILKAQFEFSIAEIAEILNINTINEQNQKCAQTYSARA